MSIFEDIAKAETLQENEKVEVDAGLFLALADLWVSAGWLMIKISDEDENGAAEAVLMIAESYGKLGEKYAG